MYRDILETSPGKISLNLN